MAMIEVAPGREGAHLLSGEQYVQEKHSPTRFSSGRKASWWMMWGCLFIACIGAIWFSYQYFLVPQPRSFAPDWHTASWIQASNGSTPVGYFRSAVALKGIPGSSTVTIGANQTFRLYVNNTFIGSNETDFLAGDTMQSYIYDITSALVAGSNMIVIRVANLDKHPPIVRAAVHFTNGASGSDDDTGSKWQATTNSGLVFPHLEVSAPSWNPEDFGNHPWPLAQTLASGPALSPLPVDPGLYQRALPRQWISAGAQTQGYYVRQLQVTNPLANAWVRFAAVGPAEIFVNGDPVVYWDGTSAGKTTANTLSYQYTNVVLRTRYMAGVYDIAPYLHTGQNTIAVYVSAPNAIMLLGHAGTSLSLELLMRDEAGNDTWSSFPTDWHVSQSFAPGWQQGSSVALAWPLPVLLARPLSYRVFYMPDSNVLLSGTSSVRSLQSAPILMLITVVLASIIAVLLAWLLMAFILGKRYYGSLRNGMVVMSVAFLPALALEGALLVLARQPQFSQPFPYNTFWGLALIALVILAYLLLWCQAFLRNRSYTHPAPALPSSGLQGSRRLLLPAWFRRHWTVLTLMIVGAVLVIPTLQYEPYWQDELVSYFVAQNSISHGFPQMLSGFIYAKGELFHYMLGILMTIFGTQNGVPRVLSVIEYIATIFLLYYVGMRFFNRRVGWLAAAMLTLSPYALIWSVQERMYQQAQLGLLLMLFVFYIAVHKPNDVRLPYMAIGSLLLTYLSHEETFIMLPGLVLGVFLISKSPRRILPGVFYQKHWWYAALLGICIIGGQLLIVSLSHPPVLGTDQSSRPDVQLNEDAIGFYFRLLFVLQPSKPWIMLSSLLAVVGCIYAVRSRDKRLQYCALFLVASTLTLVFLFTMHADRYFYPLLPVYYLVGAYALVQILQSVWNFTYAQLILARHESEVSIPSTQLVTRPLRWLALLSAIVVCGTIIIAPILPTSNNSLTLSRLTGGSYYQHFADYDVVGTYIEQHWQAGDIIISISPDVEMSYYVGRSDYYLSIDRALFLMEKNNHLVNTATGAIALLNQQDLNAVLAQHPRVWLVSDHAGYEISALRRFTLPNSFHIVCEGARTAVYLRGD